MAYVKWKDPRRKPPRGAIIDWSDPITRGLVGCWLFNEYGGDRVVDLVNNKKGILENGATWSEEGIKTDNIDDYIRMPQYKDFSPFSKWTFLLGTKTFSINTSDGDWIWHPRGQYDYSLYQAGSLRFATYSDTTHNLDFNTSLAIGKQQVIACKNINQSYSVYLDGAKRNTGTLPTPNATADYNVLGGQPTVTNKNRWYDGVFYFYYHFSRALTDEEIKFLSENPYSFFLVPVPRTYIVMGGGGTTIDESLSEGATAGDSLSATVNSSATATEGAKAGDTYLDEVSSEVQEAISEGAVAGDSFSVEVISAGNITEGAKAGDTATAVADPELALSEGAKAGDLLYPQASGDPTYRYVFNPFTGTLDKVRAD